MNDRRGHRVPVAALLRLIVVGLVAACGTTTPTAVPNLTTGPTIGPATAPPESSGPTTGSTSPPSTTVSGARPCTAADLKASHGIAEGGAGSVRFEVVLVAAAGCSVDAFPTFGIRDAGGAAVVGGVAGGSGRIDLSPDASYTSAVRVSNWCVTDPSFPLTLEIRLDAEELPVTGPLFEDAGELPPCNGEGGANLEAGAWTAGL